MNISTLYKTELCRSCGTNKKCKYGKNCKFAHNHDELRSKIQKNEKYKTYPCMDYTFNGLCPYGNRCHFQHVYSLILESDYNNIFCLSIKKRLSFFMHLT
jgi:hypothetical protein